MNPYLPSKEVNKVFYCANPFEMVRVAAYLPHMEVVIADSITCIGTRHEIRTWNWCDRYTDVSDEFYKSVSNWYLQELRDELTAAAKKGVNTYALTSKIESVEYIQEQYTKFLNYKGVKEGEK